MPSFPRPAPLVRHAGAIVALAAAACTEVRPPPPPPPLPPPPVFAPGGAAGTFRDRLDVTTFQRGNLHTHSLESDGDAPPEAIYAWYRDHGYNFLALSDHNALTNPARYRTLERPGFVIVPAEEVTMRGAGAQVHVNAICHHISIGGGRFPTIAGALHRGVAETLAQGGVALVNHPNWHWAFGAESIPAAAGARLLEIWSGHPGVHPDGDAGHSPVEAMWDAVLTQGMDIAGVAVDDMHNLGASRDVPKPGPGRGWVEVFAATATEREICDALGKGALVASNGPKITRLTVEGDTMRVTATAPGGTVEFLGHHGASLAKQPVDPTGAPNVYRLVGGEQYVRARVTAADGSRAWTQAYRVTR